MNSAVVGIMDFEKCTKNAPECAFWDKKS